MRTCSHPREFQSGRDFVVKLVLNLLQICAPNLDVDASGKVQKVLIQVVCRKVVLQETVRVWAGGAEAAEVPPDSDGGRDVDVVEVREEAGPLRLV